MKGLWSHPQAGYILVGLLTLALPAWILIWEWPARWVMPQRRSAIFSGRWNSNPTILQCAPIWPTPIRTWGGTIWPLRPLRRCLQSGRR